jgi:hypothetical protein
MKRSREDSEDEFPRLGAKIPALPWTVGQKCTIFHVPKDVLRQHIFQYLNWCDLRDLTLTCLRFYRDATLQMYTIAQRLFPIEGVSFADLNMAMACVVFYQRDGIRLGDLDSIFGIPTKDIPYVRDEKYRRIYNSRVVVTRTLEKYGSWRQVDRRSAKIRKSRRKKEMEEYDRNQRNLYDNKKVVNEILTKRGYVDIDFIFSFLKSRGIVNDFDRIGSMYHQVATYIRIETGCLREIAVSLANEFDKMKNRPGSVYDCITL